MNSGSAEVGNPNASPIEGGQTEAGCVEAEFASTPSNPAGKLVVLTGPSGVGKGTLVRKLIQRHPNLYLSISATTRSPRDGEIDGQDYYFLDRVEFEAKIAAGDLLEWAEFAGNYYGTPKTAIRDRLDRGESVLLEIELEGARQVRQLFDQAISVFILPPSIEELEHRLRTRARDSDDAIVKRLARAAIEIAAASEFDIQIVNDDLETALVHLEHNLSLSGAI
ncbi:MAG: guanylate kinase [Oscillatoriales cyanobacterium]|jgi:guanylate kinase|nr:MAG: guanylate kinase [Oscillatoriales cyanobacterium]